MSLQDLIPVVNKLQDIVTTTQVTELDLPILAVVGSQSCGKLLVLENIVGRDFLPRGTGIVTRRPLVLQLIHVDTVPAPRPNDIVDPVSNGSEVNLEDHLRRSQDLALLGLGLSTPQPVIAEYGEFLHVPNRRYYLFSEIRREIELETLRIAGLNKGISRLPINLKIYSKNVLNLTMVDLPGLTKIPIGDQPSDIERQTQNLILEFVSKPNCIILAVSPANVDLVNSESLKLARQVDPTGKRTVGILTKLDLMDQGTNALDILKGNVYPLKLGFIGIVNRLQQDISENKSLGAALDAEQRFFASHPAYRTIASHCGTKHLAYTLNRILMSHIRERLPDIKAKLNTLMGQAEQELALYGVQGDAELSLAEARGGLVLTLMTRFASSFVDSIDGTSTADFSTKELCGGARIYHLFNEVFGSKLLAINPTHNLLVHDIRTAIRNSTGPRPSLFVPELAFDLLVKPQIKMLALPSRKCVELVYEEMMKIVHSVCASNLAAEMNRYPRLQAQVIDVCLSLLRERLGPTIQYVDLLVNINTAYINTNHPNFVGAAKAMAAVVDERQRQRECEQGRRHRLALERLRADSFIAEEVEDEDDHQTEGNEVNDLALENQDPDSNPINYVDDAALPPKVSRRTHLVLMRLELLLVMHAHLPDLYLNYFFGKDPIIHQQQMLAQAQLHPTPFKFPVHGQDAPLQFNLALVGGHTKAGETLGDEEHAFEADDSFHELTEREQMECELIRRLIVSYFGIVRETIMDQVPKSIMCLLVNHIKEHIQNRLVVKLYHANLFDELLMEDEGIQAEREKCLQVLQTYREAARVIGDVI